MPESLSGKPCLSEILGCQPTLLDGEEFKHKVSLTRRGVFFAGSSEVVLSTSKEGRVDGWARCVPARHAAHVPGFFGLQPFRPRVPGRARHF